MERRGFEWGNLGILNCLPPYTRGQLSLWQCCAVFRRFSHATYLLGKFDRVISGKKDSKHASSSFGSLRISAFVGYFRRNFWRRSFFSLFHFRLLTLRKKRAKKGGEESVWENDLRICCGRTDAPKWKKESFKAFSRRERKRERERKAVRIRDKLAERTQVQMSLTASNF